MWGVHLPPQAQLQAPSFSDLTPLVQSFWGRNVTTGSSVLSVKAPRMSHTETTPLVLPLTRNCPLLAMKGNLWADRQRHSGGRGHSYPGA